MAALIGSAKELVEERVEVNQRHLIDKILARYSSEFTVYRELIQNSNDAGSRNVEVIFCHDCDQGDSASASVGKKTFKYSSIVIKNDGRAFTPEDWNRLKKIAEGNPDEDKIGFFGVGFYSLFSICEEPLVISGSECMAFFWKGDQLYAKRANLSDSEISGIYKKVGLQREMSQGSSIAAGSETSFFLQLRDATDLPDLDDFGRFLATSLLFTKQLCCIRFYDQMEKLLDLRKKCAPSEDIAANNMLAYTPNRLFKVKSFSSLMVQLDVEKLFDSSSLAGKKKNTASSIANFLMKWAKVESNKLETYEKPGKFCLFMKLVEGHFTCHPGSDMISKMERTTKKKPPSQTAIQLMFTNYEQYEASDSKNPMFKDLLVFPEQGKIFIGFATHQTTGCTFQLAAQVIPTVERETIDFVDPTLNIWNQELLYACGMMVRTVFEDESKNIIRPLKQSSYYGEDQLVNLYPRFKHLHDAICFHESTPHSLVGRIITEGFFRAFGKTDISCLSSHGLVPVSSLRLETGKIGTFLKKTPVLPRQLHDLSPEYYQILRKRGLLQEANFEDIMFEISNRRMEGPELIDLLKWWISFFQSNPLQLIEPRDRFLRYLLVDTDFPGDTIYMSRIKYYTTPNLITPDLPVDRETLSLAISKHFSKYEMEKCLNLQELHPFRWSRFIIEDSRFLTSHETLESALASLSRLQSYWNEEQAVVIFSSLGEKKCIVTQKGMMIPRDCYLPSVKLVDNLPIVQFKKRISEEFLVKMGVRSVPSLETIFSNLSDLKWDNSQLIKYLTSIKDQITPSEKVRLKEAALFERVGDSDGKKYKANDLFFPSDELVSFGFPIIAWKHYLKPTSDVGEFLMELGLQTSPPLSKLIEMVKKATTLEERLSIFSFLSSKQGSYHNEGKKFWKESFLITTHASTMDDSLVAPENCYTNKDASILDFHVVDQRLIALVNFFGLRANPSGSLLTQALLKRVKDQESGDLKRFTAIFEYFGSVLSEFSARDLEMLSSTSFIPVTLSSDPGKVQGFFSPNQVFFKGDGSSDFEDVFPMIDFGSKANVFLYNCGVKREPSVVDLAHELVKDPAKLLAKIGTKKYMEVLKRIAVNVNASLKRHSSLLRQLSRQSCLLGQQVDERADQANDGKSPAEASLNSPSDSSSVIYTLQPAEKIFLNDDPVLQQLFNPVMAPAESVIENFYEFLGCKWLSKSVETTYRYSKPLSQTGSSRQLEKAIHERAVLLLFDSTQTGKQVQSDAQVRLEGLKVYSSHEIKIEHYFQLCKIDRSTTACLMSGEKELIVTENFDYYDVSSQIGRIIYETPRLSDNLLFSTLLSSSLNNLRSKGFPVDRILQKYQQPKGVLKQEQQPLIDGNPNPNTNEEDESSKSLIESHKVPHANNNENNALLENDPKISTNISRGITDAFPVLKSFYDSLIGTGGGSGGSSGNGGESLPESRQIQEKALKKIMAPPTTLVPREDRTASTTVANDLLEKQLLSQAVESCLPSTSDDINSPPITLNPERQTCREKGCEIISAKSLIFYGEIEEIKIFYRSSGSGFSENVIAKRIDSIVKFSAILKTLALIFGISDFRVLNIFYDNGSSIAFNRNRSLFFNLFDYEARMKQDSPRQIMIYWYLVFCHELSHNFVSDHNKEFSHYLQSFAYNYMENLLAIL